MVVHLSLAHACYALTMKNCYNRRGRLQHVRRATGVWRHGQGHKRVP